MNFNDFEISFPDTTIIGSLTPATLEAFSYKADLFSMYSSAKVIMRDCTRTYYNYIKVGQDVNITLRDAISHNTYTNKMKVLSFKKIPEPQIAQTDRMELILVSNWYFANTTQSLVYKIDKDTKKAEGENIGSIVSDALSQQVFSSYIESKDLDITTTDDLPHIRYQINQKTQDFLNSVLKYGRKDNLPVYLYTDAQGKIRLKGISDFKADSTFHVLVPDRVSTNEDTFAAAQQLKNSIRLINYNFDVDSNAPSDVKTYFTVAPWEYLGLESEGGTVIETSILAGMGLANVQTDTIAPELIQYYDWTITPEDATSVAAKDAFEKTAFSFTVTGSTNEFRIDDLAPGKKVRVVLPYDPVVTQVNNKSKEINLGEGMYMVTTMAVTFQSSNSTSLTSFSAIQISN